MYPVLFTIANFDLRASYVFLFLGILIGILVGYKEAKRVGISKFDFHLYWISAIPIALFLAKVNGYVFRIRLGNIPGQLEDILGFLRCNFGNVIIRLFPYENKKNKYCFIPGHSLAYHAIDPGNLPYWVSPEWMLSWS
jgi:hypothetical protein